METEKKYITCEYCNASVRTELFAKFICENCLKHCIGLTKLFLLIQIGWKPIPAPDRMNVLGIAFPVVF